MKNDPAPASFRDPNGFLFTHQNTLYRQINISYAKEYATLIDSGLYAKLLKLGLLIAHEEADITALKPKIAFKVIKPEPVRYISYPYEWSFSQIKDAALVTLAIQKQALKFGMTLKDASAYNIQFHQGKAVLIDTLSFETYIDGEPWVAYKQFCQHFLALLALMSKTDIRLNQLMRVYIDGIPLDLASCLLPFSTRFNFGYLTHIHLHAQAQARYANQNVEVSSQRKNSISKQALQALIENLENVIKKIEWNPSGTEWGEYYTITNYTDSAFEHKKQIVDGWVNQVKPNSVWDFGGNDGTFTRIASEKGIPSITFDIDAVAVEKNYRQVKAKKEKNILPLLQDLTNPSSAIGWHSSERDSLSNRAPTDMVFAFALIHHLAISNNVPLSKIADFFASMGIWLAIEFVPKSDSQVQKLLTSRKDIFDEYTIEGFEKEFKGFFEIQEKINIQGSERYLYLMKRK